MLVLVTSDHGNIEDLSVRGHTLNPVPTLLIGPRRHSIAQRITMQSNSSLTDLTPAILSTLSS